MIKQIWGLCNVFKDKIQKKYAGMQVIIDVLNSKIKKQTPSLASWGA